MVIVKKVLLVSGKDQLRADLSILQPQLAPRITFATVATLAEALTRQGGDPDELIIIEANQDRDPDEAQREFQTARAKCPRAEIRLVNFNNFTTADDVAAFFESLSLSAKFPIHQFKVS